MLKLFLERHYANNQLVKEWLDDGYKGVKGDKSLVEDV